MILGFIGSRDKGRMPYDNPVYLSKLLEGITENTMKGRASKLISGGSKGPETFAVDWATDAGILHEIKTPKLGVHGPLLAFVYRNQEIIDDSDLMCFLLDTANPHMQTAINYAVSSGKQCIICPML